VTSLQAIIVDDEPPARRRLRTLLKDHSDIRIVAECGAGKDAVTAIHRHRPDIVFLDIQMPDMDGFAVIEELGVDRLPAIIFVTAYDKHAVRAFEVNALDYLLKPFDENRFAAAIARARRRIELRNCGDSEIGQRMLAAIAHLHPEGRFRARFAVKSRERVYFVPTVEIDWIEAAGKYVRFHVGSVEHLHRLPIGQVETELDPARFVRIHRSTIVNVDRIKELQPLFHGEYVVILRDGTELTLSRGYRCKLRALLDLPD